MSSWRFLNSVALPVGDPHRDVAGISSCTANYDAAGNMTCRAPTNTTTCAGGSPNGAQLSYDNEGRLASWQNTPSVPTTTAQFLYDGAGQRVEQGVNNAGTTTSTVYVGQVEEVSTTGRSTTTTTYYYAGGKRVALAANGTFSYLGVDGLGSASVALDGSGSVQASVLYAPYGAVRYSSGTMPGSYGYTGSRPIMMCWFAFREVVEGIKVQRAMPTTVYGLSVQAYSRFRLRQLFLEFADGTRLLTSSSHAITILPMSGFGGGEIVVMKIHRRRIDLAVMMRYLRQWILSEPSRLLHLIEDTNRLRYQMLSNLAI